MSRIARLAVSLVFIAAPSWGADPAAGQKTFKQRCVLCHTAEPGDNGGGQGPALTGVFGRKAASDANFGYSRPLRDSGLVWDAATLDRFLKSPPAVVRGTTMTIAVPQQKDRDNLIAYFVKVKDVAPAVVQAATPQGEADWKKDAPGRSHRIDLKQLTAPFASTSARNFPKLVERPSEAQLSLPPGFKIDVFARGLVGPRLMAVAPNGDVIVTETSNGRLVVLHPAVDGKSAASTDVFAEGLSRPFGIAFYPNARAPQWLYVGETNRIIRYAYKPGDRKASGAPEVVVASLPTGGGHFTRDVAFSPDGKRMFVSVGSATNVAQDIPKKTVAEAQAWEQQHGLGAAWDKEADRAVVLAFDVGAKTPGKIYAAGIRNCVGLTIQPVTNDVWCTTNERDLLGDDLVPDYSTRVKEGGFYGWPWYYMGDNEDPRLKGERPDLRGKIIVPDVPYQAHSAALTLTFYTATSGAAAFPKEYVGDGIAALHGSWNRGFRTGHKLVRVRMNNGVPTGEYQDFLTGFIVDDGNAWGRPVATAVMADGSMLVSDDSANLIYRIAYAP